MARPRKHPPKPPRVPKPAKSNLPDWAVAWNNSRNDAVLFATGVLGFLMPGEPNPKDQHQLEPWQVQALKEFSAHDRLSIRSGHGVGKALSVNEPVLTPSGWKPIGSINIGDRVAAPDGTFSNVIGVYPQGERQLFRVILDDGCSVLADADHCWLTQSRSERKHNKLGRVRTTAEIAASLTFPNGPTQGLNHSLPRLHAVQHPRAVLPVDPYILGVLLGDGDAYGRLSYGRDREILPFVAAAGGIFGRESCQPERCPSSTLLGVRPALRALGLFGCRAHEKFIPRGYLYSSISQRIALLQGILDTDGTVGKNCAVVLDITAKQLAQDTAELVRSLGGVVRRSTKIGKLYGIEKRLVYRLFISLPADIAPFRLPSKASRYSPAFSPAFSHKNRYRTLQRFVKSVEPAGRDDAVCIAVDHPSRLYVTRDHIVTHNTTLESIIVIWFLLTRGEDTKILCVAGSQDQLADVLWPEIRKWINKLPESLRNEIDWQAEKIAIKACPEAAFAKRRTASKHNPDALQGFHATNMLAIFEEASGIPAETVEAGQGALSTPGAKWLCAGNPTKANGFFFDTHTKLRHSWRTIRVSSEDVPRARGHIQDIIDLYGRDSNKYRVRVLGEFPTADDETVIPLDIVLPAVGRNVERSEVWPVWGVDVARFGDDSSAVVKRQGNYLLATTMPPIREWKNMDGSQVAGRIIAEYESTPNDEKPKEICVDVIGVGASVYDMLRLPGSPVSHITRGINVSEAPTASAEDYKLRDELWFKGRAWFQDRQCRLPTTDQLPNETDRKLLEKLISELTAPLYDFTNMGKRVVESKKDMKERGLMSPNLADAFLLTFAAGVYPKSNPFRDRHRARQTSRSWLAV